MENKFKSLMSGAFPVVLAGCVLAAGIGGYFWLFGGSSQESQGEEEAWAPAVIQEEPQPAQTIPPETEEASAQEEIPASMPEEPVTVEVPVVAEAPQPVVQPLEGEVVTAFSVDELLYSPTMDDWRIHDGVDIAAQEGDSVVSASAGTVLSVTEDALLGTTVVIDHGDGVEATYASLQEGPMVTAGESVSAGQIIGTAGTTAASEAAQGPHLHFSVTKDGDTMDPNEFLSQ
mgnify:FL=1